VLEEHRLILASYTSPATCVRFVQSRGVWEHYLDDAPFPNHGIFRTIYWDVESTQLSCDLPATDRAKVQAVTKTTWLD
jgi:hypothetical protein